MYCKNCKNDVPDYMTYCPGCGAKMEGGPVVTEVSPVGTPAYVEQGYANKPLGDRYGYSDEYHGGMERKPDADDRFVKTSLIIVSALLLVIIIVGIVLGVMFFGGDGASKGGKLSVSVESYPSQTDKSTLLLSGSATTKNDATISINGQFVDNVTASEGTKRWSKEITLNKGINNIDITITDSKGNSTGENISVVYNSTLLYEAGTILVKGDPAAVYVRPTPQKGTSYVILIHQNDFTSQFTCVGEESRDSEGYIWCKVRTPANGLGWIRSDLVKPLQ